MPAADGSKNRRSDVDVVVVGAGFSGLYLLHQLRTRGFSTVAVEEADDVGGTWYWNRYPGARCDVPTTDYAYTFDPELEREWQWSEKYATQPEILAYLGHVADRFDLRRHIRFSTRVSSATWDESARRWRLRTDAGDEIVCRFYVMASGCLSRPKNLDIEGTDRFSGETYFTSRWPHHRVDFTGKAVAVIGTGSSGIQAIPIIAAQASALTVFQRTPSFSMPARNGPPPPARVAALEDDRDAYRRAAKWSTAGVPTERSTLSAAAAPEQERRERFEAAWAMGELFAIGWAFNDVGVNPVANEVVAEMIREKIRSTVDDPVTAEALCPKDYPFGTKRPCLDSGYYETYNLPHVRLVDLRRQPIVAVTETGIDTTEESLPFDAIVYATGFDAMTGPIVAVDVGGRGGVSLRERWADGPSTYLGLMTKGFPNFFMITGPGSPSVLSNMMVSIEQHVEWVADCLDHLRAGGFETIEPTETAEAGWNRHVADCAAITLFPQANSWYMGANVPGKPRVFLPYVGGVDAYRGVCEEVVAKGYLGFELAGPDRRQCHDGVVRRLQPDVGLVLQAMAALDLPPLETLSVEEARASARVAEGMRPPGPEVGEVVDGVLPGPAGDLGYRLYRPPGGGPHPVLVYFHGGGWMLGSEVSDDPLCRDLCLRSGALVVSVDYRHAPEARFPSAVDDGFAALGWVAANAADLGGLPGQLVVGGWSAGANVAAVCTQLARAAGGPDLVAQVLLNPAVDCDLDRPSYRENGSGYGLTTAMMRWFWDHYADRSDRTDPTASPLRAADLSGLPPAVVLTAEFDPLRDEGIAYAGALAAAGVPVHHVAARGHTHLSVALVGIILSGAPLRAEVAGALRAFLPAAVPT